MTTPELKEFGVTIERPYGMTVPTPLFVETQIYRIFMVPRAFL